MHFDYKENTLYLIDNYEIIGYIEFYINNKVLEIMHTIVYEKFEGLGYASKLTKEIYDYALKNNYKIAPYCTYAVSWFDKHKEYSNILERNNNE
jgi:predicted GNAT family acetyltransferase